MHKKIVIAMFLAFILVVFTVGVIGFLLIRSQTEPVPPIAVPTAQSNIVNSKVYFSKSPESFDSDFTYGVGVIRKIDKTKPIETSLEELLKGPTASEKSSGLLNPIELSGESKCNGDDFRIVSNPTQLGTDIEVHFCKEVKINGIGDTARIQSVIKKTIYALEESANYKAGRIAVLDKNNNCLGDESGLNACLN